MNSGPRVWAAIWAAMLISPVEGSAATNLTSLMRIDALLLSPKVFLISLNYVLGSGSAESKGSYQVDELFLGDMVGKVNAGQTGGGQQLCETAFRLPGFERRAIQQQFVF